MTNFERIKVMNVEEMANWLAIRSGCDDCPMFSRCRNGEFDLFDDCNDIIKSWLESEVEKMRLIDEDALREGIETINYVNYNNYSDTIDFIDDAPTIEAEPVRHGKWQDRYNNGDWHCSECGAIVEKDEQSRHNWYRCYHCGAKMNGV